MSALHPQISTTCFPSSTLTHYPHPPPLQPRPVIPLSVLNDRMSTIDLAALAIKSSPPSSNASSTSSSASSSLASSPYDSVVSRWQTLAHQQPTCHSQLGVGASLGLSARSNGGGPAYSESGASDPMDGYCSEFELERKGPLGVDNSACVRDASPTSCEDGPMLVQREALFFATRSRALRVYNADYPMLKGATLWTRDGRVYAVFGTHELAVAALALAGITMHLATALHTDLEPFNSLTRIHLQAPFDQLPPPPLFSSSLMSQSTTEYTLSTNPPNPKTSFRLGDWICASQKCAAHNFGRNLACIGCGCSRSPNANSSTHQIPSPSNNQLPPPSPSTSRALPSPRFNALSVTTYYSTGPTPSPTSQQQQFPIVQHPPIGSGYSPSQAPTSFSSTPSTPSSSSFQHANAHPHPPKSAHPLLTPSGRAFAVGGKVQNVSTDPLNPCIMYWPDNEPLPDQGQIRPSGLVGVAQPPILNTGNRGPISHQPGDWICQKCNYLNWRRRKVCQTCLPYAEGNGDSISAAVQAERIALLTSVLSQTHLSGGDGNSDGSGSGSIGTSAAPIQPQQQQQQQQTQAPRSHSLTPPQAHARRPFIDISPPHPHHSSHNQTKPVHRSQSHFALGQQYAASPQIQVPSPTPSLNLGLTGIPFPHPGYLAPSPIYQTSGHHAMHGHHSHSQQHFQQQQRPQQRQPSPLLYATGPGPASDGMRRGLTRSLGFIGNGNGSSSVGVSGGGIRDRTGSNAGLAPIGGGYSQQQSVYVARERETHMPLPLHHYQPNHHHLNHQVPIPTQLSVPVLAPAPAPLLPSFLQDMVQSPSLSPTSTTPSSMEEFDELASPVSGGLTNANVAGVIGSGVGATAGSGINKVMVPRARGDSGSSAASRSSLLGVDLDSPSVANIWRLDGEEAKGLSGSGFALPVPIGVGRKTSREGF